MSKGTDQFKQVIQKHLNDLAAQDAVFAKKLANPKKNIDDCITYIFNSVKKSGCQGFADDEIYGMATHYYDEENIKVGSKIGGNVVVNHAIELSEEEVKSAKEKAMNLAIEEQKKKLTTPKKKKKSEANQESDSTVQTSLF